jgi:transmembrane sensor
MSDSDEHQIRHEVTGQESSRSEEAIAWFSRLRSERCSAEERRAFEAWRKRSPDHANSFEEVCALWDDPALQAAAVQAVQASDRRDGVRRVSSRWLARVAVAATVAGLVIAAGLQLDIPLRLASDYRTSTGERQIVQLPDHSTVTLNTQSAIAADFDGTARRVHLLRGEAFFQVAPDKQKAFVVESRQITTRAVGTAFLVREEPDGIRVTVAEGVVELAPSRPGWTPIQLTVRQQVSIGRDGPGPVQDVELATATAWLRGRLVVDGVRLGDVIDELRRYHPGAILIWNRAVNDILVSGSYDLADPAGVLAALVQTLPIQMARITDRFVLLF